MAKNCELQIGITHSIVLDVFKDDIAGVFLNAATTVEAKVFDVNDPSSPVEIAPTITLIFVPGSDGKYRADFVHDFSDWVNGDRVKIEGVAEEGANHFEDELLIVFRDTI